MGELSYVIALVSLGTASGVEILASRSVFPLGSVARLIASLAGLLDVVLILAAFAIFPLPTALGVIAVGIVGTAILSKALPSAIGWVVIPTVVGIAAMVVHFVT